MNGLHLEQYRHATYPPEPYYFEALRRDPADSRCNNALGLLLLRRGKFAEAEAYFRAAVESLTRRNPNPYDGEAFYNLGLSLKFQGRFQEATDAFYTRQSGIRLGRARDTLNWRAWSAVADAMPRRSIGSTSRWRRIGIITARVT